MYFLLNAYICICCFFCHSIDLIPICKKCSRYIVFPITNTTICATLKLQYALLKFIVSTRVHKQFYSQFKDGSCFICWALLVKQLQCYLMSETVAMLHDWWFFKLWAKLLVCKNVRWAIKWKLEVENGKGNVWFTFLIDKLCLITILKRLPLYLTTFQKRPNNN